MHITLRIVRFEKPKDFLSDIIFEKFVTVKYGQRISIGRSDECEIYVEDEYCSAIHTIFQFKDNKLLISDSISKNGTKVNGTEIQHQVPLFIKDVISIGKTFIHIDEDKTAPTMKEHLQRPDDHATTILPSGDFDELTNIIIKED